ncbi:MAG: SCP2 sterol-binding domain-containing protein [Pseudomonadota bacterium]
MDRDTPGADDISGPAGERLLRELTARLRQTGALPSLAGQSVRIVVEDAGSVLIEGGSAPLSITPPGEGTEGDCDVHLDGQTLDAILSRDLAPDRAFMTGRLKVKGDLDLARRLIPLLKRVAG